jgi:hypothetical protein
MVRNIAVRSGYCGAKKTFLIAALRGDRFVRFSIQHNLNGVRVWSKDPDLYVVANLVRT